MNSYQKLITYMSMGAMTLSISSIISTAKSIFDILGGLSSVAKPPNVNNCLIKLDLEVNIDIVQEMLKELKPTNSKAVYMSIDSLKNILMKIEYELFNLEKLLKYNNSLYVIRNLRSYDLIDQVNNLSDYKNIMDCRLRLLFDLLVIKDNFVIDENYKKETNKDTPPEYEVV